MKVLKVKDNKMFGQHPSKGMNRGEGFHTPDVRENAEKLLGSEDTATVVARDDDAVWDNMMYRLGYETSNIPHLLSDLKMDTSDALRRYAKKVCNMANALPENSAYKHSKARQEEGQQIMDSINNPHPPFKLIHES